MISASGASGGVCYSEAGAAQVCCTKKRLSLMNTKFNERVTSQLLLP